MAQRGYFLNKSWRQALSFKFPPNSMKSDVIWGCASFAIFAPWLHGRWWFRRGSKTVALLLPRTVLANGEVSPENLLQLVKVRLHRLSRSDLQWDHRALQWADQPAGHIRRQRPGQHGHPAGEHDGGRGVEEGNSLFVLQSVGSSRIFSRGEVGRHIFFCIPRSASSCWVPLPRGGRRRMAGRGRSTRQTSLLRSTPLSSSAVRICWRYTTLCVQLYNLIPFSWDIDEANKEGKWH